MGDPPALEDDPVRAAHRVRERSGPHVLPDEQCSRAPGLKRRRRVRDVVLADETADLTVDDGERRLLVDLIDLEAHDGAVCVLADEDEVQHTDEPVVDELRERRCDLALELVPREPHDEVLDRSHTHAASTCSSAPAARVEGSIAHGSTPPHVPRPSVSARASEPDAACAAVEVGPGVPTVDRSVTSREIRDASG